LAVNFAGIYMVASFIFLTKKMINNLKLLASS
jgi:hypothetical protein